MKTRLVKVAKIGGLIAALVIILLVQVSRSQAQKYENYRVDGRKLTDQEKYVLAQIEQKKIADLKEFGEAKEQRRLRAHFLEKLVIGEFKGIKVSREIVEISNAVVEEDFFLEDAAIPYSLGLHGCIFKKEVNFRNSLFKKNLAIDNSEFHGPVYFSDLEIGGSFLASESKFSEKDYGADFYGLKVKNRVLFKSAVFEGPVYFGIDVHEDLILDEAVFQERSNFSKANIGGNFYARKATFQSKDKRTHYFNSLIIGGSVFFDEVIFYAPVDFGWTNIKGEFGAYKARFEDKASFYHMNVGSNALFDETTFRGGVDFFCAGIGSSILARKARFEGENRCDFEEIKVEEMANFDEAVFQGWVIFLRSDIKKTFRANEAIFRDWAGFAYLKVGQNAVLDKAEFEGPVDFVEAEIKGQLKAGGTGFHKDVDFGHIKIKSLLLDLTRFGGKAFFNNSEIGMLLFNRVQWPKKGNLILDGMTYSDIEVDGSNKPAEYCGKILDILKLSDYPEPYLKLENYFKTRGYSNLADQVFIAGKRRECREEIKKLSNLPNNIAKFIFWDFGVGYGRKPLRAFGFSSLFVLFGFLIFSRPGVLVRAEEDQDTPTAEADKDAVGRMAPFWYSLDLFIPAVNLGPRKHYRVSDVEVYWINFLPARLAFLFPRRFQNWIKHHRFPVRSYCYVHRLMGALLITIGVAAITGIIK